MFRVGDKVKIIGKSKLSDNGWVHSMNKTIGESGIITHIIDHRCRVKVEAFGTWWYMPDSLIRINSSLPDHLFRI